jgi:hypothetical protein
VDDAPVVMPRGRHRRVAVPAGRHRVVMTYAPRLLGPALLASALALLAVGCLVVDKRPIAFDHTRSDPA